MNIPKRKLVGITGGMVAVAAFWLIAVDRVRFEETCGDCQIGRTIRQDRLATFPLRESVEERPSLLSIVAEDLGALCPHEQVNRLIVDRRIGLTFQVHRDPVLHPTQKPWFPECARESARALVAADPGLPSEFRARVLDAHDWVYWTELRDRIFEPCPPDQHPDSLGEGPLGSTPAPASDADKADEADEASDEPEAPSPDDAEPDEDDSP